MQVGVQEEEINSFRKGGGKVYGSPSRKGLLTEARG